MIPNILAERYATQAIKNIWSAEGKILLERNLWIAVMKAQKELGLDIPQEAIDAYEKVKTNIRIDEINKREKITRHDVKARIEEFCELAGFEHIHKGMTSRDLTECVEQLQVFESLKIIRVKAAAALHLLAETANKHKGTILFKDKEKAYLFNGEIKPIVLKNTETDDLIQLILPIRTY